MIVHLAAALPVLPALLSEDFEALKRDMHTLTRAETLMRLAHARAYSRGFAGAVAGARVAATPR